MGLFILSFILIFTSTYLLISLLKPKRNSVALLYIPIFAFAQIVFTFEFLSLFSAIEQHWVLLINSIILSCSIYFWNKRNRPLFKFDFSTFLNRFKNALKLDKSLIWLFVGFLVFVFTSLFLSLILPITNLDAQGYHFARSAFWVANKNLLHFEVADIRNLCLPINSEILYSWVLLFVKRDVLIGMFSFTGYVMSIISLYGIMGLIGISLRKILWTIFMVSSLAFVIVQASSSETDIIISGLMTACIYLFWSALKSQDKKNIFVSSLAFALAIGTKTPALMATPGLFLFLSALSFSKYKKEFYKPMVLFACFSVLNFIIFSSYNYVLNLIHFSNPFSAKSFTVVSKNYYGIKGMFSNFIKYFFLYFDFAGFRWSDTVGPHIINFRDSLLSTLFLDEVKDGHYFFKMGVNRSLLEPIMGSGVLGFLAFIPCLFISLIKPLFAKNKRITKILFAFGLFYLINLICMSYLIAFMNFSNRFLMFFTILSAPVLYYSYFKRQNIIKIILIAFSLFYLMAVSTHIWARPIVQIVPLLKQHSLKYVRQALLCKYYRSPDTYTNTSCLLANKIKEKYAKENKILIFANTSENIYLLQRLNLDGYNVDFGRLENINNINLKEYNIIITSGQSQTATVLDSYETRKNETRLVGGAIITEKGVSTPCLYIHNEDIPLNQQTYPYTVECVVTTKMLKENNLKQDYSVGIVNTKPNGEEEAEMFLIFNNLNNPIIKLR